VPVCSPSLWSQLGPRASEIFSLAPLIQVTSVSEEWSAWFRSDGIKPPDLERGLRVDTIQMSMEAAVQGLGVALGRKPLVDDDLAQGRLVEAGPVIPGNVSYWLVGAERAFERPEIKLFRNWLLSELDRGESAAISMADK
jgi:LysR family glycine cleavage system transcriptional activator